MQEGEAEHPVDCEGGEKVQGLLGGSGASQAQVELLDEEVEGGDEEGVGDF